MTDQERATAVVLTWADDDVMVPKAREAALALAEEFAAVRREERKKIVAYLRRRVQDAIALPLVPLSANTTAVYVASVQGEADRIERGEHS